jgi:1,4-dihydroxy-2-naphthoate octaprenyltransferase
MILEPHAGAFPNALVRYIAATRPAFLTVTLIGCLIGLASAAHAGFAIDPVTAFLTVFFALVAHGGVNVVNDYYDALNGSDAANSERQFPFTGGSRFIQNGVMSVREAGTFGHALLVSVIPPGLWLTWHSNAGLIWIGLAGLLVGWTYSAPPFKLMCRGVGELAIVAGWLLVSIGADFVQRGSFAALPVLAGLPFALFVANILFINQFPDRKADAQAGKNTVVVRLGPQRARWGYPLIVALAHLWQIALVINGSLPLWSLVTLLTLPLSLQATRLLLGEAERPANLVPAIKQTILAANLYGLLLTVALALTSTGIPS